MSRTDADVATWALLSVNKLPPGKFTEHTLGCVVSDINNPTDDCFPPNNTDVLKVAKISEIFEMNDTNAEHVRSTVNDANVRLKLTDIFSSQITTSGKNETTISSQMVITRILTAHPEVFQALQTLHSSELRSRMKNNKKKPGLLYMIVGFKTCVDADISSYHKQVKEASADVHVPLDKILLALGLPLTFGADLGAAARLEKIQQYLSKHVATGERIFAVQYRQITTETTWKFKKNTVLNGYATSQGGLMGDDESKKNHHEEVESGQAKMEESSNGQENPDDDSDGYEEEEDDEEDEGALGIHEMQAVDFSELGTDCFEP